MKKINAIRRKVVLRKKDFCRLSKVIDKFKATPKVSRKWQKDVRKAKHSGEEREAWELLGAKNSCPVKI